MKAHTQANLLTPAEATALIGYQTIDTFAHVKELYECYKEQGQLSSGDFSWDFIKLLTLMYNAGRIDGIRSERARRKV